MSTKCIQQHWSLFTGNASQTQWFIYLLAQRP